MTKLAARLLTKINQGFKKRTVERTPGRRVQARSGRMPSMSRVDTAKAEEYRMIAEQIREVARRSRYLDIKKRLYDRAYRDDRRADLLKQQHVEPAQGERITGSCIQAMWSYLERQNRRAFWQIVGKAAPHGLSRRARQFGTSARGARNSFYRSMPRPIQYTLHAAATTILSK
jgi:hypothetical protein